MLWLKSWIEVRWRALFGVAVVVAGLVSRFVVGVTERSDADRLCGALTLLWLFIAVVLAGSGVKTQSPFQPMKGLHGSTQFMLSLPVGRWRLLAVRSMVGMASVTAAVLSSAALAWTLFPLIRAASTPSDLFRWAFTGVCCAMAFYALSTLVSIFLDEAWQMWGTVLVIAVIRGLTFWVPPPPALDVFRALSETSPLLTHSLPWPAISVCLVIAGGLFTMAAYVIDNREFC